MADLSGRELGDFVLLDQIGQGGYASVYRCEQPLLKRHVVIKVLQRTDEVAEQRFLREAQLASRFEHPYAAHIYAFGVEEDDGLLWIAMELVQGSTLEQWLERHGPMPLDQFVPFIERVADVVQAAHELGIVHRDLKPSNIMVVERAGKLYPKLLDFGIAKVDMVDVEPSWPDGSLGENQESEDASLADEVLTRPLRGTPQRGQRTKAVRGTPQRGQRTKTVSASVRPSKECWISPSSGGRGGHSKKHRITFSGDGFGSRPYMSPEQWKDAGSVGPAGDIYSLGIIAYEVLTGRRPFVAQSTEGYYQQHCHEAVPPLGEGFSAQIERVIRRALSKSPDQRQSNVLELAEGLRAVLRASAREQLRASAQQWQDRLRAPGLLWGPDVLAELDDLTSRVLEEFESSPSGASSDEPSALPREFSVLECSFVATSHRRARRMRRVRQAFIALPIVLVVLAGVGALLYRAEMHEQQAALQTRLAQEQTRAAQHLAEATATESELEQGRSALLHGEPDAQRHLTEAYRRDRSPSTAFMLARALQPRLAEQARLPSSFGRMWSATFSPNGNQAVTTDDKNAQIWDAQTFRLLFTLPHGDVVYQAVYSADGTKLVTACGDGAVRIWDVASGMLVRELRHGSTKPRYYAIALSPDNKVIAAIEKEGSVAHVWDAVTGAPLAEIGNEARGLSSIAFSSDGHWLATTGGNNVRVFDTKTWARIVSIPGPGIDGLSWDPSGPRLLTGSAEGDASLWSIPSGKRLHHLRELGEPVDAVAFSPDGRLLIAASRDGAEQVWEATSGKLRSQGNYLHGKLLSVAFDATSSLVVAAGASGAVAVSDAAQGMPITVLDGSRNVVLDAHFDPSSRRVIAASWDGTARVWDATSPYRQWSVPPVSDDCGLVTSLEPDRRFLAIGCKNYPTRVWDTDRDLLLAELPSVTPAGGDFASAYPAVSAAGDRAAIARGNSVEVYELPGGKLLRTIAHRALVNTVAFAATGRDFVSGAVDGALLITRDNGALVTLPTSSGGIDAAGFLPDGRVVAADAHRRLRFYDAGGTALADLEIPARARTLRMSSDSLRLITVPSFTGKVAAPVLWDLEHYRPIAELEDQGQGQVYSARFVAGGQILTACGDGAVRLWDSATGGLHQTYRGGSRFLVDVTLSADGSMLVAGGGDGLLRFWDAASARPLWTMPVHKSHLIGVRVEGDNIVTRGFSGDISRWSLPKPGPAIEACGAHERCAIVSK